MSHVAEGPTIEQRYALGERVARGAFGEVLRGTDLATGAAVAVKRLLVHVSDPSAAARFALEARVLARVDHPHVVRYIDSGHDADGRLCLVLEWLDGKDLSRFRKERRVTMAAAVEVARQVALGLDALHAAGVVHRDVKPANVFVVDPVAPRVKLVDLGIARAAAEPSLTAVGARIGTPAYMAPEQARGSEAVDPRTDVYSLGVVLYELLAGRRPMTGNDPFALLMKILLEEPTPLRVAAPWVPDAVAAVVARAMSKPPEARFPSAVALADALAGVAADAARADEDRGSETATLVVATAGGGTGTQTVERRVVTAVFAAFPPGAALDRDHDTFAAVAARHGGVAHRTLGGYAAALFGLARSTGDEAVRAARAALSAAEAVPGARLAVATSRVLARDDALDGAAIERGARLVDAAAGGSIRVDDATARLLAPVFECDGPDDARVLRGERALAGEAPPRLLGRATPTLGRDRELATLDALVDECEGESVARVALVTGAAGVGKSRVRFEWLRRLAARASPPGVLVARGDPLRAESPYALLAQALRAGAGVRDGDAPEVRRERLRERVARRMGPGDDATRVAEFLGELAGVEFPDEGRVELLAARREPRLMADQVRRAWEDFLAAETRDGAVLALVFEDVHWGDRASIALVDHALRELRERPLLVVGFARQDVRATFPRLWADAGVLELALPELPRRACERLVRAAIGEGAPAAQVHDLVERAAGNAFYLEELVRAVAGGGAGGAALPDTVLALVQARLDALDADARRVLRVASVFGQTFWARGLLAALGALWPDTHARDWVAELCAREVVVERRAGRFAGESEYAFRHALVRDAAYAMLSDDDRAAAHLAAGEWLARAGETDAALLAAHFERGGAPARAAAWYARAAEQALEANDLEGALARAARGAACVEASGERAGPLLGALRSAQAEAHHWRGENADAERRGREALALLAAGSPGWFGAVGQVAVAAGKLGHEGVLVELAGALAEASSRGDHAAELDDGHDRAARRAYVVAASIVAVQLGLAGRHDLCAALVAPMESAAVAVVADDPAAAARVSRARAELAFHAGDPGAFLALIAEATAHFERAGDLRNACAQRVNVGFASLELGAYGQAEAALRSVVATAGRHGLAYLVAAAKVNLGLVLALRGELAEALAVCADAVAAAVAQDDKRAEAAARFTLSRAMLLAGDADAAAAEASRAIDAAEHVPTMRVRAIAALAAARLAKGETREARAAACEAVSLAAAHGADEGEALVRLVHAEALARAGDAAAARAAASDARARVLAQAARIADEAMRRSFLENVPEHAATLRLASALGAGEGAGE